MKTKPRKKIHPATRRAIEKRAIEVYEQNERIVLTIRGQKIMDITLAAARAIHRYSSGSMAGLLHIELGRDLEMFRRFAPPEPSKVPIPAGAPICAAACGAKAPTRWQKIKQTVKAFFAGILAGILTA